MAFEGVGGGDGDEGVADDAVPAADGRVAPVDEHMNCSGNGGQQCQQGYDGEQPGRGRFLRSQFLEPPAAAKMEREMPSNQAEHDEPHGKVQPYEVHSKPYGFEL